MKEKLQLQTAGGNERINNQVKRAMETLLVESIGSRPTLRSRMGNGTLISFSRPQWKFIAPQFRDAVV